MTSPRALPSSNSSAVRIEPDEILGCTEPRVSTPPLRPLRPAVIDENGNVVVPATSYGFAVIDFARDVLEMPLDEWEELAAIRGGELLPNGKPRFRKLLIIVGRQNGKTFLLRVLVLFWIFVEQHSLTLFVSNDRKNAKKAWKEAIAEARRNQWLKPMVDWKEYKTGLGQEEFLTHDGCEFLFAAPTGNAGRSMTVSRLVLDELREHHDREVWASAYNAMNAKPFGQVVCASNQGTDKSVLMDELRDGAHAFIRTGKGDPRLGILEWSAPDGASPLDPYALAQSNPNMNRNDHGSTLEDLLSEGERCLQVGGDALGKHLTEVMGIRIRSFDGAINPDAWAESFVEGDLSHPSLVRVAALDVSGDRRHVTLMGGARLEDGRIRVEALMEWDGSDAIADMRRDLPGILKGRFRAFGWIPNGPTAAVSTDMKRRQGVWPPQRVVLHEIPTGETADICMALAEQVDAGQIVHNSPDDDMLTSQITGVVKKRSGNKWFFQRPDESTGYADAAYATAVVVHLVRNLPAAPKITKTHALRGI